MRKMILISVLGLCMLVGCSTHATRTIAVDSTSPESGVDKRLTDSKEQTYWSRPARPFDFREITLDNGLRVLTMEDFSSPIVAVQVWYHVGSKDENPNRQGFAHMFEHMMFRGTELLGPEGHFNLIRSVGGTNNGFTNFDYTAYVNGVPANQLDLATAFQDDTAALLHGRYSISVDYPFRPQHPVNAPPFLPPQVREPLMGPSLPRKLPAKAMPIR